ncbi:glycosyltransferase family 2 protein [Paenibacillus aestuarii]|uniref:Glycosyltransferase family 2 protein n=1 Tax=Paenibacillus aestuarii TaxID=516965 RepID=A0ABW0K9S2_9BACL|nr:glycosyltransferase family 2 protein [Paenibacillus aestuarii]
MQKAEVTVVIPVYNREKYIENAIKSVQEQTYKDWKMIVIDDGSTDNSVQVIKPFRSDKRIQLVTLPRNQGIAKALQTALNMIRTPYFVIVDSDDWIIPNTLEVLLKEMKKQPESTSLIYGNTKVWQEKNGELKKIHVQKHRSFQDKYDLLLYNQMFYPRFFRTVTVRQVGGFKTDDPYEGRYAEDRNLLLRLIAISRFHWVDKNLYNLRKHSNNITKRENIKKFETVMRYVYTKVLKDWGNEYEPVFKVTKSGWLIIKELKKIIKKNNTEK